MGFLDVYLAKLPEFEGCSPWMYLDSRKVNGQPAPLVTVGIGCAIGVQEACTLPFVLAELAGDVAIGPPLIELHYDRLRTMRPGMLAAAYKYDGCPILRQSGINALALKRLLAFVGDLRETFEAFDGWPDGAKIGALDLIYGVGFGGLQAYTHFREACRTKDWATAADECGADANVKAYAVRNAWRKAQFLNAACGR